MNVEEVIENFRPPTMQDRPTVPVLVAGTDLHFATASEMVET